MLMLNTNILECIVTKTNSHHKPFCDTHSKPHGARGFSKNYHLRFDPKLSIGVYVIRCLPCACVACTSMLDKPWIFGIPLYEQEQYKPVTKCTY